MPSPKQTNEDQKDIKNIYKNLQILPENTSKDRNKLTNNRKYKCTVKTGNRITLAWEWMNLLRNAHITKRTTNKTTTNECGGIRGKTPVFRILNKTSTESRLVAGSSSLTPAQFLVLVY